MTEKAQRNRYPLPFNNPAELELWSGRGAITFVPLRSTDGAMLELGGSTAGGPEVEIGHVGNVVRVDVRQNHRLGHGDRDEARIAVWVPPAIRAHVHADAGTIEARELGPCALWLETGAGRIALFDVSGQLRLVTGAGQIAGRGLRGSISAETNAGAILLQIDALDPGDHYVHARAGAIRLELARDLDARVEISSRRGSVQSDLPERVGAAAVLHVSTDVGSINVRGGRASGRSSFFGEAFPHE